MTIEEIFYLNKLAKETAGKYTKKRYLYPKIKNKLSKDRIIGIIGPRGTGKTVLLKQILQEKKNAIYISLDLLDNQNNLFENIVSIHKKYKKNLLLLDEVHYLKDFSTLLKKIYEFTNIKVLFTSSIALYLSSLQKDLSRKISLLNLYPFSFSEYLFFSFDLKIPKITFDDIISGNLNEQHRGLGVYFEDYLKGGLYPFSLEVSNINNNLNNILERIINNDIPMIHDLTIKELQTIKNLIEFIGKSQIDGINYSSLSNNLGITKYKAKQYVDILEKTFILNSVQATGTNINKEPKIVMTVPYRLLYTTYENGIGGLREDFAVQMLKSKPYKFYYLKSKRGEKRPDYLLFYKNKKIVIEIGGKNKGFQQFKGIDSDKFLKLIFSQEAKRKNSYPLYFLGLV